VRPHTHTGTHSRTHAHPHHGPPEVHHVAPLEAVDCGLAPAGKQQLNINSKMQRSVATCGCTLKKDRAAGAGWERRAACSPAGMEPSSCLTHCTTPPCSPFSSRHCQAQKRYRALHTSLHYTTATPTATAPHRTHFPEICTSKLLSRPRSAASSSAARCLHQGCAHRCKTQVGTGGVVAWHGLRSRMAGREGPHLEVADVLCSMQNYNTGRYLPSTHLPSTCLNQHMPRTCTSHTIQPSIHTPERCKLLS